MLCVLSIVVDIRTMNSLLGTTSKTLCCVLSCSDSTISQIVVEEDAEFWKDSASMIVERKVPANRVDEAETMSTLYFSTRARRQVSLAVHSLPIVRKDVIRLHFRLFLTDVDEFE